MADGGDTGDMGAPRDVETMTGGARPYVDERVAGADVALAQEAARVAARHWRIDDPVEVRQGMNIILRAGDVALRVGRPNAPAECSLELAEVLREQGVPVVRPVRDDVVRLDHLAVTAWEFVEHVGPVDWHGVGAAVRRVHEIDPEALPTALPFPTPTTFPWWDFTTMLDAVGNLLDPGAREGVEAAMERGAGWGAFAVDESIPTVVCHGDVHPGNVIQGADGPLLIDWDLLCRAPAGWDHAPLMTWEARWGGENGIYERFAAGYGRSARGDELAEAFAELRLVAATLMRVRAGVNDPQAMAQARERLRYWRGDPDAPVWRAV